MAVTKLKVVGATGAKNPVYNSIKRFSIEGLDDLIRVLMENVDDTLFALSDKVDSDQERKMYFAAMREIRLQREALRQVFHDEIKRAFERVLDGKTATSPGGDDEDLTLIELDELEDKIAIGNMISRARPQFEDELFAVGERMKLVLRRKGLEEDENPLDPKTICESFRNASRSLQTSIQVKLIFYKLFERHVISNLGHFYREVNDLFVKKGVLPGFKADQERMKQTTRFMANRIKNDSGQVTGETPIAGAEGNLFAALQRGVGGPAQSDGVATHAVGEASASGGEGRVRPDRVISALTRLQSQSLASKPAIAPNPQNLRAATQQQLQSLRAQNGNHISDADGQTIDVVSMLFDFFFDDEALPAPIKVLIGRLQIPMVKLAILDKEFFNQKKHPARKLLDSISRASLGWRDNHDDEQALVDKTGQIVKFLVEKFDNDIGVFEIALANFEKFVERDNKALQQKEQQEDSKILAARDAAEGLIARLTHNRELGAEVIDFLQTTWSPVLFNAYLSLGESSNHWRKLKRISTTLVWTLLPKHSEEDRLRIIKTIPPLLRALSKGMELIDIETEVKNRIFKMLAGEHARIVKMTSKNIVTRVDDQTVWPEDGGAAAFANTQDMDAAEAPAIKRTTERERDKQVDENAEDSDSITIIDLTETSDVIEDLNQFTAGVMQGLITIDEEIVMESADGDDFDLISEGEDYLAMAQKLEIGDWVEFNDPEAKPLAARLSWKSNVTSKLVFVNRQGQKVRILTFYNLATELRTGLARFVDSSSMFDRAIDTILAKVGSQQIDVT